jgi:hypothetical protein
VSSLLRRSWLTGAVLAVPVALTLGSTVRDDADAIREHSRLSAIQAEVVPPFRFAGYSNVPLLVGMRRLVPENATIAFVSREPADVYLQTGWVRWAAFVLAPRLVVEGRNAPWLVVVHRTPGAAKIHGRRVWRFGDDWLVQR